MTLFVRELSNHRLQIETREADYFCNNSASFQASLSKVDTAGFRPNWDGPPYLLLGADVAAMTGNVTSSIFDIRFVDQNLGGLGSKLRSTIRLGYLTHIETEYYKSITSNGFFLQPHLSLSRDPVYL